MRPSPSITEGEIRHKPLTATTDALKHNTGQEFGDQGVGMEAVRLSIGPVIRGHSLCDSPVAVTTVLPKLSARYFPRSVEMTLSSSASHLFPTRTTWALSHEYILI